MYLRMRWCRTRARVLAALVMADSTLIVSESARYTYIYTSCICEYTYVHSGSERVRTFWPRQRWLTAL